MEDFATYEIAVKLKEKGFTKPCRFYYSGSSVFPNQRFQLLSRNTTEDNSLDAPTISQALKWLREEKEIDILPQRGHINLDNNGKVTRYYNVNIYFERRFSCTLDNDEQDYSTYEKAAIAGLNYCLENLI